VGDRGIYQRQQFVLLLALVVEDTLRDVDYLQHRHALLIVVERDRIDLHVLFVARLLTNKNEGVPFEHGLFHAHEVLEAQVGFPRAELGSFLEGPEDLHLSEYFIVLDSRLDPHEVEVLLFSLQLSHLEYSLYDLEAALTLGGHRVGFFLFCGLAQFLLHVAQDVVKLEKEIFVGVADPARLSENDNGLMEVI